MICTLLGCIPTMYVEYDSSVLMCKQFYTNSIGTCPNCATQRYTLQLPSTNQNARKTILTWCIT